MFIIFDLDDTLIDTSASITPIKLELALRRMVREGLELDDFEEALKLLLRLDLAAESAKIAIEEFLDINEFDLRFLQIAEHEVYHTFSEDLPVYSLAGAKEALSELSYENKLAIVSRGKIDQQLFKLKKAGIDTSFFCKIVILEKESKKESYRLLGEEFGFSSKETIVCGDRISIDLVPAKQLGCWTVHMKKGRGILSQGNDGEVDFSITELSQLKKVLLDISNQVMVG